MASRPQMPTAANPADVMGIVAEEDAVAGATAIQIATM
jgi:hypothetical protein